MDVLEDYVTQCFADVPNNGLPADDFTLFKGSNSFDTPSFRKIYKIKPIKDICQVSYSIFFLINYLKIMIIRN